MRTVLTGLLLTLLGCMSACPESGTDPGTPTPSGPITHSHQETPTPEPGFSVLALNLHCLKLDGTPYADNMERVAAIAAVVVEEGVAALLLQEVCDDGTEDMLELLRTAIESADGSAWSHHYGWAHTGWQGTPDEAEEGLAVLARGSLTAGAELEHRVQAGLRRVTVAATLPPELGSLRVASVHFDVGSLPARTAQSRETASWSLLEAGYDLLIGGDFNDVPGSAPHEAATSMGFRDLSASLDEARIDHIMLHRGAAFEADRAELIFTGNRYDPVSDHPGVLVHIVPGAGEPVLRTTLIANHDPGFDNTLWVRGDVAPLDWAFGLPAHQVTGGRWTLVLTEVPAGDFEFKFLIDDEEWQTGANVSATAGQQTEVTPSFF